MSRDPRKGYYRDRDWNRSDYNRGRPVRKRSRSPPSRSEADKRRSRSPRHDRKNDKDLLDDNILSEISKLPEPSELWDSQFQDGGFPAQPAPAFQEANSTFANQPQYQQPHYSGIYDDFPPVSVMAQPPQPLDMQASWNQMGLQPPPPALAPPPFVSNEDQIKKEAAIESEMRHQKAALSKQREDYMKKANILKKELDTLKDQRNELRGDAKRSPSPDTKRFLKENTKLQLEIQNKLKTIYNVVDMLNGIIGEDAPELPETEETAERGPSKRKSRSPSTGAKYNYVYYDPEMHWCRVCNEFPSTAKDYLNHLHSPAHHKMAAAHMEAPWHSVTGVNEGFPSFPSAPTKRTPIKGLQFFVPSTAWYCKLCDQFIGDLHCASAHLKSITHSKNYTNFVEQNPHWETDWMSDRQKAIEKSRANKAKPEPEKPQQYAAHTITFSKDGFHTKRKSSPKQSSAEKKKKDKKKKKKRSSSSSSSGSSSSDDSEEKKKKKKWMTGAHSDRLNESDRKLLDTLKNRMKSEKAEEAIRRSTERARERESAAEILRKIRESERRESRSRESRERSRHRDSSRSRDRSRDDKKPETKKMPFIGKMPVFKHLSKSSKADEQKKEDDKKKDEEDESSKKKREEIDAEIQKKVAEFKEKIARSQLEKQQQVEGLAPPSLVAPTHLATPTPAPAPTPLPHYAPPPPPVPTVPTVPTLPKDFQEALDIIFPAEVKNAAAELASQDQLFMPPGLIPGLMPPFPMPLMNPQMFGFDLNAPLFPPRPQLYDTHVPLVPNKPRPKSKQYNSKSNYNNAKSNYNSNKNKSNTNSQSNSNSSAAKTEAKETKKREELDDLAMLGIDASDVGSGM